MVLIKKQQKEQQKTKTKTKKQNKKNTIQQIKYKFLFTFHSNCIIYIKRVN